MEAHKHCRGGVNSDLTSLETIILKPLVHAVWKRLTWRDFIHVRDQEAGGTVVALGIFPRSR